MPSDASMERWIFLDLGLRVATRCPERQSDSSSNVKRPLLVPQPLQPPLSPTTIVQEGTLNGQGSSICISFAPTGGLVDVVELLSRTNKLPAFGRATVVPSYTRLVEHSVAFLISFAATGTFVQFRVS